MSNTRGVRHPDVPWTILSSQGRHFAHAITLKRRIFLHRIAGIGPTKSKINSSRSLTAAISAPAAVAPSDQLTAAAAAFDGMDGLCSRDSVE